MARLFSRSGRGRGKKAGCRSCRKRKKGTCGRGRKGEIARLPRSKIELKPTKVLEQRARERKRGLSISIAGEKEKSTTEGKGTRGQVTGRGDSGVPRKKRSSPLSKGKGKLPETVFGLSKARTAVSQKKKKKKKKKKHPVR